MKFSSTLFVLLLLTLTVGVLSGVLDNRGLIVWVVFGISSIKFLLVAFQFMELKKAHSFWKCLIIVYVAVVSTSICLMIG